VGELDHQAVARSQARTLRGLVHRARSTRFGHDHDFGRIRTVRDFQRLVPLRTPAALWQEYWQAAFPHLTGTTWPEPVTCLGVAASQNAGSLPYIPVSPALWVSHRRAAMTALAFLLDARPQARLLSGQVLFLADAAALTPVGDRFQPGSLEETVLRQMPLLVRPAIQLLDPKAPIQNSKYDLGISDLGFRTSDVTCLAGPVDRLLQLLDRVQEADYRRQPAEAWPRLAAILYTGGSHSPERAKLRAAVRSEDVLFLETCISLEGAVAVEDPRHGLLRLLPDHGVFFEFVPVRELRSTRPARHMASEVEVGVRYAMALTSPAGLWSCCTGTQVCFERRDPPLLRLLEPGKTGEPLATPAASRPAAAIPFPWEPAPSRKEPVSEPAPQWPRQSRRHTER
jgi:hypothetical protein